MFPCCRVRCASVKASTFRFHREFAVVMVLSAAFVSACVTEQHAPVVERGSSAKIIKPVPTNKPAESAKPVPPVAAGTPSPQTAERKTPTHTVQKGETLYSIARQYGLTHQEVGVWNNLSDVNAIKEGMVLRLSAPGSTQVQLGVTVMPIKIDAPPEGKPVAEPIAPPGAKPESKPQDTKSDAPVKLEPKATRVPYSEAALAKMQRDGGELSTPDARPETKPEANPPAPSDNESLQWGWPTSGKIVSSYSEASKGIDITGVLGQPILSSADGRVSYIGNSLRGYGKMIVIIHNKSHLSLYAHNNAILVKEGQTVTKGQKIAEMGNSDADDGTVKLHFEIRRAGKPVDPLKYLPSERS